MKKLRYLICFVSVLTLFHSVNAAEDKKSSAILCEDKAGPDFQTQGEYTGTINGKRKLGAQVIARGNGKFEVVFYSKGLPGDGWDKSTKLSLAGKTVDGKVKFNGFEIRGELKNGLFEGVIAEEVFFVLRKVIRKSPTLGLAPPKGAIVLFDGKNVDTWDKAPLEEGGLLGVGGRTKRKFKNYTLHLEFRLPFMPGKTGQARGNSGMYLSDQYECQVLDSFGLNGENNECGGFYKIKKPNVNMCFPPLSWQTYDVEFQAAQFDKEDKKISPAIVTVRHNGTIIHDKMELPHVTPGGGQADEKPGAIFLQDHGNPVRFRNIWIKEK